MTIFTPTLFAALFKATALLGAAGQAPDPENMPQDPPAREATPAPDSSVKSPPRQVSEPEEVVLDPAAPVADPVGESAPTPLPEAETVVPTPAPSPAPVTTEPVEADEAGTEEAQVPRDEILANVRAALSDVTTAKGRFEQINPDGTVVTGNYALSRPGRVRFEYDDPVPLLLVADGTNVAQIDTELEETETVPLAATPLKAILGGETDFDSRAEVTQVNQGRGFAAVTVVDPNLEYEGSLTLLFDMADWTLEQWTTVDSIGAITVVRLLETETGARLDPRLFRVEDPRDDRDRDRRR
jgi:outer membrane lipoprotein-sorting protein